MAVRPIRLFGDPVLRRRADEVVDFDRELRDLVADLRDTMVDAGGSGIAAPQVHVSKQLALIEVRVLAVQHDRHGLPQNRVAEKLEALVVGDATVLVRERAVRQGEFEKLLANVDAEGRRQISA